MGATIHLGRPMAATILGRAMGATIYLGSPMAATIYLGGWLPPNLTR